jgi:hypothetical protein
MGKLGGYVDWVLNQKGMCMKDFLIISLAMSQWFIFFAIVLIAKSLQ